MRIQLLGIAAILSSACSDSDDAGPGVGCGPGTHLEGQQCVPDSTGVDGGVTTDAPGLPAGAKRVFVTRTTYKGNLGGRAGADALCQNAASAAALTGTWQAWLSDFAEPAVDQITGTGPWYDLQGARVFANHAALTTAPSVSIEVQEDGQRLVIGERVWTGAGAGGTAAGAGGSSYCYGWTSTGAGTAIVGNTGATTGDWTEAETLTCSAQARLYCFEN